MTQQDKELLLKDLSARLPYGVIFKDEGNENLQEIHYIKDEEIYTRTYPNLPYWIGTIKPYLRPMSSMTEEEKRELFEIGCEGNIEHPYGLYFRCQDWLNANHFDYRGLIEKGLALEVTEENNPYVLLQDYDKRR